MVISAFIFITRIVFCSTNVLSVAALNATTSVSARHNIISARTPASYTATFEAVATDELQECLWCRLLVHPVNGYVTVNHIPAMTMWTVHSFCRTVCTELCPCLRRCFRTVSIKTEHIRSSSWPNELPTIIMAARMFGPDSIGKWGNGTPAFCLFPRIHLCCHIRLTHVFQAVLCTHIHQAIVHWQSCQGTSFVASYRY